MITHNRLSLLIPLLAACEYTPPIVPAIDVVTGEPKPATSVIAGDVVLATPVDAPSDVIIFITPAADPMPPTGTGRPLVVSTVPAEEFTGSGGGMISAAWSATGVPDGDYYITAFMDMDSNFSPLIDAMSGSTCGDIVGAHLDNITDQNLALVTVQGGEIGTVVDEVTIVLAQTTPFERPAFTLDDPDAEMSAAGGGADPTSQTYELNAIGIHSSVYDLPGPESFSPTTCGAIFPLYAPDSDGDGQFDPHPTYGSLGLYDLWPKVFIQYLGVPNGDGTFDTSMLAEGESWAGENVPSPKYTLLGTIQPGQIVYKSDLEYVWLPGARHSTAENPDGEIVQDVSQIPRGAWSVTMISFTGQTWTVPNALPAYPPEDGWDAGSQAVWLNVGD